MIRTRIVAVVILLMMFPRGAYATWGWLERLSGPGPFGARTPGFNYRLLCFEERTAQPPDGPHHRVPPFLCMDRKNLKGFVGVEFGTWESSRNDLAPDPTAAAAQVRITQLRSNLMVHLHDTFDAGVGFGWDWFSGDRFDTFTRIAVEPVKLSFVPLALFGSSAWLRVVKINTSLTRYGRGFSEGDFCTSPRCTVTLKPFQADGEYRWGSVLLLDFSELVGK